MAAEKRFEPHPQSATGDFYVVNHECTSCGAPHVVAPDLIGWNNLEMGHCIWKKQPETPEELEQAFLAFDACCLGCYRYAGNDPSIKARIGSEYCDHPSSSRKPQSFGDGVLSDSPLLHIPFTRTTDTSTSLLSQLVQALTSPFKRK